MFFPVERMIFNLMGLHSVLLFDSWHQDLPSQFDGSVCSKPWAKHNKTYLTSDRLEGLLYSSLFITDHIDLQCAELLAQTVCLQLNKLFPIVIMQKSIIRYLVAKSSSSNDHGKENKLFARLAVCNFGSFSEAWLWGERIIYDNFLPAKLRSK